MLTLAGHSHRKPLDEMRTSDQAGWRGKKHGPTSRGALDTDSVGQGVGPWVHAVHSASTVFPLR